jgi:hypothetical protein
MVQVLQSGIKKSEEIGAQDIICTHCSKRPAEIFQVTGDFCLECWQAVTHTNI